MVALIISTLALLAVMAVFRLKAHNDILAPYILGKGTEKELSELRKQNEELKLLFNRPFYFSAFVLICITFVEIFNMRNEFIIIAIDILGLLAILFSILRFYNMFNFDDYKQGSYGFEKLPIIYEWFFKPRIFVNILKK